MNAPQVISNYESLQVLTSQMRDAATRGEWDKLLGLEHECLVYVATMKQTDSVSTLDEPARQRKIGLIKKILANDAVIRNCTEAWVAQLQDIIRGNNQERRVQHAYSAGH
jgi:flagellar protein FliT